MATGQYRNTTVRDRHRNTIRARRDDCGICHEPIDYTLRTPDPDSFEVDHIIPRIRGGADALANKQAAHRRPAGATDPRVTTLRRHHSRPR